MPGVRRWVVIIGKGRTGWRRQHHRGDLRGKPVDVLLAVTYSGMVLRLRVDLPG
jgi:hypothetical protein